MKNDGGPAFPYPQKTERHFYKNGEQDMYVLKGDVGMSLRDWFAGQALAGLLASQTADWMASDEGSALRAFRIADAMLAEREKRNDSPS